MTTTDRIVFFGDNTLIKSKLDRKLIIQLLGDYGEHRKNIEELNIHKLYKYSKSDLYYLYQEYHLEEDIQNEDREDDPDYKGNPLQFQGYKQNYLIDHPEENPPK
jgi:hypothetical protein